MSATRTVAVVPAFSDSLAEPSVTVLPATAAFAGRSATKAKH